MFKKNSLICIMLLAIIFTLVGCGLESEESYKKDAVTMIDNYEDFNRQPDNYKNKKLLFTVRIENVSQKENMAELIATPHGQAPLLFHYKYKNNEPQIKTGDMIRVWGEFKQISNKKFVDFLPESKIFEIDAKYISMPAWGFMTNLFGMSYLHSKTDNNQSLKLSLSGKKITAKNLEFGGSINFDYESFHIQGSVDDTGIGSFAYVDDKGTPIGAKGTLKIVDNKTVELETEQVEIKVFKGFARFGQTDADKVSVIMPAGKYTFKN